MPPTVLPDLDVEKLRRFCKRRVPDRVKDRVRLELTVTGKRVSIHERRPPFLGVGEWTSSPIAQVRYEGNGAWTLYFGDRYGKWMLYFDLDPRQPVDVIIKELEADPPRSSGAEGVYVRLSRRSLCPPPSATSWSGHRRVAQPAPDRHVPSNSAVTQSLCDLAARSH